MTICPEMITVAGDDIGVGDFVRFWEFRYSLEGLFSCTESSANNIPQ
jgi:hypothetical protein